MKTKTNEALVKAYEAGFSPIVKSTDGKGVVRGDSTCESDVFNANLPDGITPKIIETVAHYTGESIAAGTKAFGASAVKALADDPEITTVTGAFTIGALGSVAVNVDRVREGVKPGTTEKTTTYGANRVITSFKPGDKVGALSAAQSEIKQLAKDALSKD